MTQKPSFIAPPTPPFSRAPRRHLQGSTNRPDHLPARAALARALLGHVVLAIAAVGQRHVYTWTVIRRALDPAFQSHVALLGPFTVVVVALDVAGRPLLPGTLIDCAPERIEAEMAVEIVFQPLDD